MLSKGPVGVALPVMVAIIWIALWRRWDMIPRLKLGRGALIVAIVGGLSNTGAAHPLTENFSVFGYHVTGSTGSLFLFGIVVSAVALLGLSTLLAGARRTAGRGRDARLEHQQNADTGTTPTVNSNEGATPRRTGALLGRWSRIRQPVSTGRSNGHHSRVL